MKSSFLLLAVILTSAISHADINCQGYNIKNKKEMLDASVTMDGDPLVIQYKIRGTSDTPITVNVNIIEKDLIRAQSPTAVYEVELRKGFPAKQLPAGYNAMLIVREASSAYTNIKTEADKTEYVLKCSGQLPKASSQYTY